MCEVDWEFRLQCVIMFTKRNDVFQLYGLVQPPDAFYLETAFNDLSQITFTV